LLQSQLDASRQSLADSEENLDRFIQNNIEQIRQETGETELGTLSARLRELEAARLSGERQQAQLDAALTARDWQLLGQTLQNDALIALQNERAAIAERLSETDPSGEIAVDLAAQLQALEDQLAQTAQSAVSSVRADISAIAGQSNELRRELRTRVLSSQLSASTLTALYGLQQEADIAQRQYSTLITRMRDLEAQAVVQLADSRLVSPALAPTDPASPNKRLVLALALVFGVGLGLGLAFLNEYYVGGVASESQLANLLPISVGTVVPLTPALRENASVADAIIDQPLSVFSESFRKLRASIDQAHNSAEKSCKVIMITSAVPGEGKTSIALSLARTYAQTGKRVLLIDADLRKPALHKHIAQNPREGLQDFLIGQSDLNENPDIIVKDPQSSAVLILGGGRPSQPTDQLLQSDSFAALIESARSTLDIVIIDTSPLVPVVDARYIAPMVDAALLVVRYSATTQTDLRYAYDQLSTALPPKALALSVLSIDAQKSQSYKYAGYYTAYTVD
jgi:capsular exopolysaccharide synthesis family protein